MFFDSLKHAQLKNGYIRKVNTCKNTVKLDQSELHSSDFQCQSIRAIFHTTY